MIAIQDVLISEDIVKEEFVCNLSACKGACCWKGDFGAPVTSQEISTIQNLLPLINQNLSLESQTLLSHSGAFAEYQEPNFTGTNLHPDGSCVFMIFDDNGVTSTLLELLKTKPLILKHGIMTAGISAQPLALMAKLSKSRFTNFSNMP